MNKPYAIALSTPAAEPILTLGSGLPAAIEGKTCHYRRKEIAYPCEFFHRGTGEHIKLTPDRLAKLSAAIQKRIAKGIRPPITPYHVDPGVEFNAKNTLGYVVGAEVNGETLYADLQMIGDDALDTLNKNGLSIATMIEDAIDADGEPYEEALHHLAVTPDKALPDRPTLKIAASAGGGPAREVRIFTLSAAAERSPLMKPETIAKLRAKLNLAADVKDEDVAERAAALALADPPPDKGPEVVALSAKVKTLETERDAIKAEAEGLRLSAASAPPNPDGVTLAMYQDVIGGKRESAIAAGTVSEARAKEVDALLADVNGRPTPMALSACGTRKRPLAFELWDLLAKPDEAAPATQKRLARAVGVAPGPNHQSLVLSGAGSQSDEDAAKAGKEQGEAWRDSQLKARGVAAAAGAGK